MGKSNIYNNSLGTLLESQLQGTPWQNSFRFNITRPLITLDRLLLSNIYNKNALVKKIIDKVIDDAYRGGFIIKTAQLSPEEINNVQQYIQDINLVSSVATLCKKASLFGGAALLVNTNQDPSTPLDEKAILSITSDAPLDFYTVSRWELLSPSVILTNNLSNITSNSFARNQDNLFTLFSNAGGATQFHQSRVLRSNGEEALDVPTHTALQGWGLSILEGLYDILDIYFEKEQVVHELIKEAKISIFGIRHLKEDSMSSGGQQIAALQNQLNLLEEFKNNKSSIIMDAEDSFEQKQISFSGLGDLMTQIRIALAGQIDMPLTKLFGQSATGFSSGEEDIENYNSMIESKVRNKNNHIISTAVSLICQKVCGIIPSDLQIEYKNLRILTVDQEIQQKRNNLEILLQLRDRQLLTKEAFVGQLNASKILANDIDFETDVPTSTLNDIDIYTTSNE